MNPVTVLCLVFAAVTAAVAEEDAPFSIGLGTLSPSYSQSVGKENVRVKVEQKGDGFSYTIGDPTSGVSSFYSQGSGAQQEDVMSGLPLAGFYGGSFGSGFPSSGSGFPSSGSNFPSSGSNFPSSGSPYGLPSPGPYPHAPAYEGHSGYSGPAEKEVPGTYQAGSEPSAPASGMGGILPAGFSYHGTDGQAFLRQGDVPDFAISGEGKDSDGPAEKSFHRGGRDKSFDPFQSSGPSSGQSGFLTNGFVGYGSKSGSQVGVLPIGGFAKREHGGHTIEEV